MNNCNEVMLALKRWMAAQPRSLDPDQPRPSPREVLFDDVAGSVCFLPGLDFPRNTIAGFQRFGYVGDAEQEYVWIRVDHSFERLMASWRSCWGPELDQHFENYVDSSDCGPTPEHRIGPEGWRVRRHHMRGRGHTEDPAVPWEPSREFDVMGMLVDVRSRVIFHSDEVQEVHFGWEITSLALYRQDEGLTLFDPLTEEVLAFGMEPTPLPAFLEPFGG